LAIISDSDVLVQSLDDLLEPFHSACKPPSAFRVGTEAEKIGWQTAARAPLPFAGSPSVQLILRSLAERFGWKPEREHAEGEVIALLRGQASITLEPAGQLELSGAPFASIHETHREFEQHFAELHEICDPLGVAWLSLGFHPFAKQSDLPSVPKLRYAIMERYLPTRGPRALDMMRRTCTVQANLDYGSEADAMRKLRIGLALQPITTALFANSPIYENRLGNRVSERADVWLNMDPDRSGLIPFAWERSASFHSYVEWALDVPMFLVKRGSHVTANTEQTFRQFMAEGSRRGERATMADWRTHVNTLFPEARLKNTLEMRGVDAQPRALTCALPALWKGLLYDERAISQCDALIEPLSAELMNGIRPELANYGLRTKLLGRPLSAWALEVLEIARGGLERLDVRNERGENEAIYLDGIEALAREGRSPSDTLRAKLRDAEDFTDCVVALTRV
jgi:glutamate--cysteine ligase